MINQQAVLARSRVTLGASHNPRSQRQHNDFAGPLGAVYLGVWGSLRMRNKGSTGAICQKDRLLYEYCHESPL
jgi:hypothetical protein